MTGGSLDSLTIAKRTFNRGVEGLLRSDIGEYPPQRRLLIRREILCGGGKLRLQFEAVVLGRVIVQPEFGVFGAAFDLGRRQQGLLRPAGLL